MRKVDPARTFITDPPAEWSATIVSSDNEVRLKIQGGEIEDKVLVSVGIDYNRVPARIIGNYVVVPRPAWAHGKVIVEFGDKVLEAGTV